MLNNYIELKQYTEYVIVENYNYGSINNNGTYNLFVDYFLHYTIRHENTKKDILKIFDGEQYLDANDNKAINDIILSMAVEHKKSIFDYYD